MAGLTDSSIFYRDLPNPASTIRLLKVHPGSDNAPITCSLYVYEIRNLPQYAAISYTWGSPTLTHKLSINAFEISVGKNCYQALWQARQIAGFMHVWIDALCINQLDLHEKGLQVQIMNEIFSQATLVLVSLGDHSEHSIFLMENLTWAPRSTEHLPWKTWFSETLEALGVEHLANLAQSLLWLCAQPYWSRTWIVQEIMLGRGVQLLLGSDAIEWLIIWGLVLHLPAELRQHQAIDGFRMAEELRLATMTSLASHMEHRRTRPTELPGLPRLLTYFGHGHCTNGLDRIYAFLNLVKPPNEVAQMITVDYSKERFSLAKECLAYLEHGRRSCHIDAIEQTKVIFHTLNIDFTNQDLQAHVSARSSHYRHKPYNANDFTDFDAGDSQARAMAQLCDYVLYTYGKQSTLKLYKTNEGRLTGNFVAHDERHNRTEARKQAFPLNDNSDSYRCVYHNSKVVAILTPKAKAGDFLVALTNARLGTRRKLDPCLVLRHRKLRVYQIVGQGLKAAGAKFCPGGTPCFCKCQGGIKHITVDRSLTVRFSHEDMIALAAQDLAPCGDHDEEGPLELQDGHIERLLTKVTSSSWSSFAIRRSSHP